MVRRQIEKATGLILSVAIIAMAFCQWNWSVVGISRDCTIIQRFGFCFFHASLFHALLNSWSLLSIVFMSNITWRQMLTAYVISALTPNFCLGASPTVGLSAVCFALLGMIFFDVREKLQYSLWMTAVIGVGFLAPQINGLIHLYSYVAGLLVGFVNMPIKCKKR